MAGDHARRRGAAAGGPDAGVRGQLAGDPGRAVPAGRPGRYPDRGAAPPRRAAAGVRAADRAPAWIRAGTGSSPPAQVQVHIDLAALRGLPGGAGLEAGWATGAGLGAGWSLARAAATDPGSVFLSGADAEAATCDAVLTPIVSGQIDWAILDQLTDLFLNATRHDPDRSGPRPSRARARDQPAADRDGEPDADRDGRPDARHDGRQATAPAAGTERRPPVGPARERPGELSPATRQRAARHPPAHEHQPAVRPGRARRLPARDHPRRALHQPQPAPGRGPQHPHRPARICARPSSSGTSTASSRAVTSRRPGATPTI